MTKITPTKLCGKYYSKSEVAEIRGVIPGTVQQWIDKGWLSSVKIPGLGHVIDTKDLEGFEPPRPGRKANLKE